MLHDNLISILSRFAGTVVAIYFIFDCVKCNPTLVYYSEISVGLLAIQAHFNVLKKLSFNEIYVKLCKIIFTIIFSYSDFGHFLFEHWTSTTICVFVLFRCVCIECVQRIASQLKLNQQ